jgi:hypothetical protein
MSATCEPKTHLRRSQAAERGPRVTLLVLSLAALLTALGCGGGDDGEGGDGYPAEVVSNFMTSCEPSAVESSQGELTAEEARSVCRCAIDELQETLSLEEFRQFDARADAPGVDSPDEVTDALENCRESSGAGG